MEKIRQPGARVTWINQNEKVEESLIPLFHKWIRDGAFKDHLMLDVADYRHVPQGPGVMLISHEAHLSMDRTLGDVGLYYQSKKDLEGNVHDQFSFSIKQLARAVVSLQKEGNAFQFSSKEFSLHATSRQHVKNTPADFERLKPTLTSFLNGFFSDSDFEIGLIGEPRAPFSVQVKTSADIDWHKIAN